MKKNLMYMKRKSLPLRPHQFIMKEMSQEETIAFSRISFVVDEERHIYSVQIIPSVKFSLFYIYVYMLILTEITLFISLYICWTYSYIVQISLYIYITYVLFRIIIND